MMYQSHLKEARERCGLSQEALARQLNVSRETIRNIEKGNSAPNVFLALAISDAVGTAISELFSKTFTE
jgi:putative transcriptional regulator